MVVKWNDLILVKHAAPEIEKDVPSARWVLSEEGRRQAQALPTRLVPYNPARLLASFEPKAIETAEIVGAELGLPVESRGGFRENDRTDLPYFDDESEFEERIRTFFAQPADRAIGTESADEAHERFSSALREIPALASGGPTIVVTHGAVASLVVARANKLDPYDFWLNFALTSFAVLSSPTLRLKEVIHPITER